GFSQQLGNLTQGFFLPLDTVQEPLAQGIGHEQEAVAGAPAAACALWDRLCLGWPRAEQGRLIPESGRGAKRARSQQAAAARLKQTAVADGQRSPGSVAAPAGRAKGETEQGGEGALLALDLRVPGQGQGLDRVGPALA